MTPMIHRPLVHPRKRTSTPILRQLRRLTVVPDRAGPALQKQAARAHLGVGHGAPRGGGVGGEGTVGVFNPPMLPLTEAVAPVLGLAAPVQGIQGVAEPRHITRDSAVRPGASVVERGSVGPGALQPLEHVAPRRRAVGRGDGTAVVGHALVLPFVEALAPLLRQVRRSAEIIRRHGLAVPLGKSIRAVIPLSNGAPRFREARGGVAHEVGPTLVLPRALAVAAALGLGLPLGGVGVEIRALLVVVAPIPGAAIVVALRRSPGAALVLHHAPPLVALRVVRRDGAAVVGLAHVLPLVQTMAAIRRSLRQLAEIKHPPVHEGNPVETVAPVLHHTPGVLHILGLHAALVLDLVVGPGPGAGASGVGGLAEPAGGAAVEDVLAEVPLAPVMMAGHRGSSAGPVIQKAPPLPIRIMSTRAALVKLIMVVPLILAHTPIHSRLRQLTKIPGGQLRAGLGSGTAGPLHHRAEGLAAVDLGAADVGVALVLPPPGASAAVDCWMSRCSVG
mmetsp:Transcript_10311/g.26200  ORF Transcript_10311/g.26200 Transcript_10311/m.26200 type:complete len:504 (+) Transcript_10311:715-2226(+)